MRLLTATAETQGKRPDDFHWCVQGELVWVQEADDVGSADRPADRSVVGDHVGREAPQGRADVGQDRFDASGIARSWIGLSSHRATTTARVSDLPLSPADVRLALLGYLESSGFAGLLQPWELERVLDDESALLLRRGARYPAGTIVERRGPYMRARASDIGRADVA
jgi:hypothetical protein